MSEEQLEVVKIEDLISSFEQALEQVMDQTQKLCITTVLESQKYPGFVRYSKLQKVFEILKLDQDAPSQPIL